VEHVQDFVDAQFKVKPYLILFSPLCLCILNYIVTFYVFFYWSDKSYSSYMYDSLSLYGQPSLSALNILFGLSRKALTPMMASPWPGNFISRLSMH